MGKIAFAFSGQGDQYPGMGKELYESDPAAHAVFETCEALRPGTMAQCFEGSEEELKNTANTQPCLFAMELAAAAALKRAGICPQMAAGFSLGEVAAASCAGLFGEETGFRLVCKRGELMQQAAGGQETFMAAVVKLDAETVTALCGKFRRVYAVNFNCPGQTTVSGAAEERGDFFEEVKKQGGRALPLKVSGAFHSPFMKEASEAFDAVLSKTECRAGVLPLYSNVTADVYGPDAARLLSKQICSPVRWEALVRKMIADGADTFIEIGPGKTLVNMIRKIDTSVKLYSVSELPVLLSEVKPC
ncbi:ACP S-malonyltransferase [Acidaminobacterium chupaoyuni]